MNKKVFLILALCLAVFLGGCNSTKSSKTIAEVNNEKITQADFDKLYAVLKADYETTNAVQLDKTKDKKTIQELETKTYDNLVLQELIRQEAAKNSVKADQKELDTTMQDIKDKKNAESKDGFKNFLVETKFTEAGLREYLEVQQLNNKLRDAVAPDVKVTDAEMRKYYNENTDQFQSQGGIKIAHILVAKKDKALAEEIISKLKKGADFAQLAKQYSIDPGSKDNGGDLGTPVNASSPLVPEFLKAALALQPGQYSKVPVESEFGYHVLKAGERVKAGLMTYEQIKDQLQSQMVEQKKDQIYNTYLEKAKKNAKIKDLRKK